MEMILLQEAPDNMTTPFRNLKGTKGVIINYEIQTSKMSSPILSPYFIISMVQFERVLATNVTADADNTTLNCPRGLLGL